MKRFSLRAGRPIMCAQFSPDGAWLAIAGGNPQQEGVAAISMIKIDEDEETRTLAGNEPMTRAIAFSPDGAWLAHGGRDRLVRFTDVAAGKVKTAIEHKFPVLGLAWSPDGALLATASGTMNEGELELHVWEVAFGGPAPIPSHLVSLPGHRAGVYGLSWSPDGARLVSSGIDGSIRVFDLDGHERLTMMHDAPVWSVQFSPDGSKLASGSHDTTARIWDASTGAELARLDRHTDFVANVCWSRDGEHVVTCGNDKAVHVWDADGSYRNGVGPPHQAGVWALAIDRAGNVAHAALDGTVHVGPESYVF